jgi:hypothetical protein
MTVALTVTLTLSLACALPAASVDATTAGNNQPLSLRVLIPDSLRIEFKRDVDRDRLLVHIETWNPVEAHHRGD